MIEKLWQVMVYVDNQEKAIDFWTNTLGFIVKTEQDLPEGFKAVEIAPNASSETTLVLFEKAFIKKYSPEVGLGLPSLMFKVDNIDALYEDLKNKGITVGEMVEMPGTKVFNFSDFEGNYFAVMQNV